MSEHGHPALSSYFMVFVALLVGTGITVAATLVDLGYSGNIILAMIIATGKASLVALIFMHLWYEAGRWKFVLLVPPLGLFLLLVLALAPDVANKPTQAQGFYSQGAGSGGGGH